MVQSTRGSRQKSRSRCRGERTSYLWHRRIGSHRTYIHPSKTGGWRGGIEGSHDGRSWRGDCPRAHDGPWRPRGSSSDRSRRTYSVHRERSCMHGNGRRQARQWCPFHGRCRWVPWALQGFLVISGVFMGKETTISAWGSKEAGDLVSKWCIISVFHDCHELNDVVSKLFDSGQDICREFRISTDAVLRGGNSDWNMRNETKAGEYRALRRHGLTMGEEAACSWRRICWGDSRRWRRR